MKHLIIRNTDNKVSTDDKEKKNRRYMSNNQRASERGKIRLDRKVESEKARVRKPQTENCYTKSEEDTYGHRHRKTDWEI